MKDSRVATAQQNRRTKQETAVQASIPAGHQKLRAVVDKDPREARGRPKSPVPRPEPTETRHVLEALLPDPAIPRPDPETLRPDPALPRPDPETLRTSPEPPRPAPRTGLLPPTPVQPPPCSALILPRPLPRPAPWSVRLSRIPKGRCLDSRSFRSEACPRSART